MPHVVVVHRAAITVRVEVPDSMPDDEFDDLMENKYEEVSEILDVRDAFKTALTDVGRPLHGYNVEVEVA